MTVKVKMQHPDKIKKTAALGQTFMLNDDMTIDVADEATALALVEGWPKVFTLVEEKKPAPQQSQQGTQSQQTVGSQVGVQQKLKGK